MNELTSMLSTTGLIATLISVLFAIAALVIANRRRKHHLAMQHAGVAPARRAGAAPTMRLEAAPMAYVAPVPVPAATIAENQVYDSTRSTSSPLFKRLGRVGGVEQVSPTTSSSEAPTQEEQKSAWE